MFQLDAVDLSLDQKPGREDERERIESRGGAVHGNTHTELCCGLVPHTVDGPLRVRPGML